MKKVIISLVGLVVIIVAGVGIVRSGLIGKFGGFGSGGNGDGNQVLSTLAEEKEEINDEVQVNEESKEELQDKEVIIRVEENHIYVGEEECEDVEDLKNKISVICSQGKDIKYTFEHEYAIKATYDEVKQTLINLEETLGIFIDYME